MTNEGTDAMAPGDPENRALRIGGRFAPGASGNPGGRPKGVTEVIELARQHSPEALQVLLEIASDPDKPAAARVSAATAILDRGLGKPPQALIQKGTNKASAADWSDDELVAIILESAGWNGDDEAKARLRARVGRVPGDK